MCKLFLDAEASHGAYCVALFEICQLVAAFPLAMDLGCEVLVHQMWAQLFHDWKTAIDGIIGDGELYFQNGFYNPFGSNSGKKMQS